VINVHKPLRTMVNAAVLSVLTTGATYAAGFALYGESAGYTTGNYGAGAAAEAADASTGWYNPAGLALIHDQELVFGGIGIFPNITLSGTSTFSTVSTPMLPNYVQNFSNINGDYDGFVPSFHYALPVSPDVTLGISVTAPYGLSTDWAPDSPVRYSATYTEVLTATVSPEIGVRVLEHLALGAGVDVQYSRVKFNQMLGAPNLYDFLVGDPSLVDSLSYNKGSSVGVGFHAGVMGIFNENHTRVGLNYESRIRHTFNGFSRLSGILANDDFNLADPFLPGRTVIRNNGLFSNPVDFPDVLTLSGYHDLNEKVALLASVVYTGWGIFKTIQLNNVAAPYIDPTTLDVTQINAISTIPQNFSDAWRVAVGVNYHINPQWMLRFGGGYDQTPTNNIDRNIRLPDADRWALAVGAHYQMKPNLGIDLGYTHIFGVSSTSVDSTNILPPASTYNVDARANFSADLVGAQLTWIIDKAPEAPTK